MPVLQDNEKLKKLLIEHNVPLSDAVKRGKFYEEYFDWDYYSELYKQGKSIRDISRLTNLSYDVVRSNLIKKLGSLRDFTNKGNSKYSFNKSLLFPKVNEYGAYLLGWLYSDGSLTHSRISIVIQGSDYSHLCYLSSIFTEKPVSHKKCGAVEFNFFDVDLCDKLKEEYNVLPNKSHINFEIPLDRFEPKTIPYLLLGLLEGDGNINKKNPSCSLLMSSNTWKHIKSFLDCKIDLSQCHESTLNEYGLMLLDFRGVSYFELLHYIYSNTLYLIKPLERKFNLFLSQIERSINGRTSPYKKLAVNIRDSLNLTLADNLMTVNDYRKIVEIG